MAPSTTKKVVLYRWDRQPIEAIINPGTYLTEDRIEWITREGRWESCSLSECKVLCFISESGRADLFTDHNMFERRPRVPGLWTRFTFRDGEILDGILSHNLLDWPPTGYFVIPPQARATRQRVFIPRLALTRTELRGVVGGAAPAGTKGTRHPVQAERQLKIFES